VITFEDMDDHIRAVVHSVAGRGEDAQAALFALANRLRELAEIVERRAVETCP